MREYSYLIYVAFLTAVGIVVAAIVLYWERRPKKPSNK